MTGFPPKKTEAANIQTALALLKNDALFFSPESEDASVGLQLGNLVLELRDPSRASLDAVVEDYRDHRCTPEGGVVIKFLPPEKIPVESLDSFLRESSLYKNVQVISGEHGLKSGEIAVFRWDFRALINIRGRTGRAFLIFGDRSSVDAVARIATSLFLPQIDSLLVHGASFEMDGKAMVLIGPSGSGKSTIAEMSGRLILSDEISVLTIDSDNALSVWGTPFTGALKKSANVKLPVRRLLLLVKDRETFIESTTRFNQLTTFLRNVVYYRQDLEGFDGLTELAGRMLDLCPVERLHFAKNGDFLEVLRWS